jgi:hypothetical protein
MALKRRGALSSIGVLMMTIGLGVFLGDLLGACSGGSSAIGSESSAMMDMPLLDKQQPVDVQTASFALG